MTTWAEFNAIPNGTQIKNNGYDQCVALANLYNESVVGLPFVPVGSAYQWWTLRNSLPVLANNYVASSNPVPGGIVVSRGGIYNSTDGHIEVVVSVNPNGSFVTMGQNGGGNRYTDRYLRWPGNGVLGFLIPKNNPASPSTPAVTNNRIKYRNNERDEYMFIYVNQGGVVTYGIFRLGIKGSWTQFTGQSSANQLASQFGSAMQVDINYWKQLRDRHQ